MNRDPERFQNYQGNAHPDSSQPLLPNGAQQGYTLSPINVQASNNNRYRYQVLGINLNFSPLRTRTCAVTPKSFIFVISVVQVMLYVITSTLEPPEEIKDFPCVLYKFGAKYTPAILTFHHFHRLISPVLLHFNFAHIASNLSLQLLVGFRLEKVIGTVHMILFYGLCGVGGNILSALTNINVPSVGASSAILGLLGLCCAYIVKYWHDIETDNIDRFIALFAIVNVFYTFIEVTPGVDNSAHFGKVFVHRK